MVEYRKLYLKKVRILEASHLPPPTCEDNIPSWNSGSNSKAKNVVFIYHNETTFNAYDANHQFGWIHVAVVRFDQKAKGKVLW